MPFNLNLVTDPRSNANDQIAHAVEVLGHARQRIDVFKAIYTGKKAIKTVDEISQITGLDNIRVLQEGRRLADNQIVIPIKVGKTTGYQKDPFYSAKKNKILNLVQNPVAFAKLPTKTRLRVILSSKDIVIRVPIQTIKIRFITIDEIESFSHIKNVTTPAGKYTAMPEVKFKKGIANILGESGIFKDWGGEKNDLHTNRLKMNGKRFTAAFAFKGPGKTGILTPAGMGKNGDQIQRLFESSASIFFVQYWGQIAEAIVKQMEEFAKAKSVATGQLIYFGTIDGDDSNRLIKAYPKEILTVTWSYERET